MAVVKNTELDKAVVTVEQLNMLAYECNILPIYHKMKEGTVAFKIIKNCNREPDFPKRKLPFGIGQDAATYDQYSIIISALTSIDEDPDEWICGLESLRAHINDTKLSSPMTEEFLIHLPEEHKTVLSSLLSK